MRESRNRLINQIKQTVFDVVIIGGGINGAAIFNSLSKLGYCVLLIDKKDFAAGTSQASSMMIWGSLPDLRRLSFLSVGRLCLAREKLIRQKKQIISPKKYYYIPTNDNGRKPFSALSALYSYWLLGAGRRSFPKFQKDITRLSFLNKKNFSYFIEYEEAQVFPSDARFVLAWLFPKVSNQKQIAINYCELSGGGYDKSLKEWNLKVFDSILEHEFEVKSKWVINTTGVWTEQVNKLFQIKTPYKHAFGKGVFIGLRRPSQHNAHLMLETKNKEGCLAFVPWNKISLWGPTETRINNLNKGFSVKPEEIRFLLKEINLHYVKKVNIEDIISIRCGVRPLVVKRSFSENEHTSGIPREYKICIDKKLPWLSIYGGKLTSSILISKEITNIIKKRIKIRKNKNFSILINSVPELQKFPSLEEKVLSPKWCFENEMCWTLDDYLRRRTNISQWVSRQGLGLENENMSELKKIANVLYENQQSAVETALSSYKRDVKEQFDDVLQKV